MSDDVAEKSAGLRPAKNDVSKKRGFLARELPTIIAVMTLLAIWFGLVAGG